MSNEFSTDRPLSRIERRRFLQGALVAGGSAAALPTVFLEQAAAAGAAGDDTILLTLTLSGGNDALNTFGPFGKCNW